MAKGKKLGRGKFKKATSEDSSFEYILLFNILEKIKSLIVTALRMFLIINQKTKIPLQLK